MRLQTGESPFPIRDQSPIWRIDHSGSAIAPSGHRSNSFPTLSLAIDRPSEESTRSLLRGYLFQDSREESTICVPCVATTVTPLQNLVKTVDDLHADQLTCGLQALDHVISFSVHIGGDPITQPIRGIIQKPR